MSLWKHAGFAGLLSIVGALGCGATDPSPEAASERTGAATEAVTSASDPCPGTRWVGRVQSGGVACPAIGSGWTVTRLFAGVAPIIPSPLDQYCLYEWNGNGVPGTADLAQLPSYGAKSASTWLDPDCQVVAGTGDDATALTAATPELDHAFAASVEVPTSMPGGAGTSVRVAVVDSWPSLTEVGTLDHGFGMAAIIRRLTCGVPGSSCFTTLSPHLALNVVTPGVRDNVDGGYFGFQARLARSIFEAVSAWQAAPGASKLVINLSVGWDSAYNLDASGNLAEGVLATRQALEYAACQGALVVAAAGNAGTGTAPGSGAMYPAGWNKINAPACAGPVARPLVFAAGGVDGLDAPLYNARPLGRSVIAAPAFQVPGAMSLPDGVHLAGPFTGSSVSAAVISAIASTVWHLDGSLRADEVMNVVRTSGVLTNDTADFCPSPPCAGIRRASLCRAVEAVLGVGSVACTKIPFGGGANASLSPTNVALVSALAGPAAPYDGTDLTSVVTPTTCSSPVHVPAGDTTFPGPYPCPAETLPNDMSAPAVSPQPGNDPCSVCMFMISEGELVLSINEKLDWDPSPKSLTLSNRTDTVDRYDLASVLGGAPLVRGGVYKLLVPVPTKSFSNATIEWVDKAGTETSSALILER